MAADSSGTSSRTARGEVVWEPGAVEFENSQVSAFMRWLDDEHGLRFADYDALWLWSVRDLEAFWAVVWEYCEVKAHSPYHQVLTGRMPRARWFEGATLNFAEHVLARDDDALAVVSVREDGHVRELSFRRLRDRVAAAAAGLRELGVVRGDRVVALLPNGEEACVALLACASIGAVWSVCSPETGPSSVLDRFRQLEPTVFLSVNGYRYAGRRYDVLPTVAAVREALPGLAATVMLDYCPGLGTPDDVVPWTALSEAGGPLTFEPMAFDDPLWVVYSSGTTGLPKGLVHGHGGITLEMLKVIPLHQDVGREDVSLTMTSTTWVTWNVLVSMLMVGSTIVLYDGSPTHPDSSIAWRLVERFAVTRLFCGAALLLGHLRAGLRPAEQFDVGRLLSINATGSPVSAETFVWVRDHVGSRVQLTSSSGGTDVCTSFVGTVPIKPVRAGELQSPCLGVDAVAFDDDGNEVVDEVGELVVRQPMPSMPLFLWNDDDGQRLHDSYFDVFPGLWRHGDWIRFFPDGASVISGRSDATLNRGGVRMGSAEFYRVLDRLPDVADSMIVDTTLGIGMGELVLFVAVTDGRPMTSALEETIRDALRRGVSPRHEPDRIVVVPEILYTLTGKKCEVPTRRMLQGEPLERALSLGALRNPDAVGAFVVAVEDVRRATTETATVPPP